MTLICGFPTHLIFVFPFLLSNLCCSLPIDFLSLWYIICYDLLALWMMHCPTIMTYDVCLASYHYAFYSIENFLLS